MFVERSGNSTRHKVVVYGLACFLLYSTLATTSISAEPAILVALLQGGVSGSASDWTDLKAELEKTYPNRAKVQVFPSGITQASDVGKWIQSERSNNSQAKVVLIGHSRGADALVTSTLVADFVILIDPIDMTFASQHQEQTDMAMMTTLQAPVILNYFQRNGASSCVVFPSLKGYLITNENTVNIDVTKTAFGSQEERADHCTIKHLIQPKIIDALKILYPPPTPTTTVASPPGNISATVQ